MKRELECKYVETAGLPLADVSELLRKTFPDYYLEINSRHEDFYYTFTTADFVRLRIDEDGDSKITAKIKDRNSNRDRAEAEVSLLANTDDLLAFCRLAFGNVVRRLTKRYFERRLFSHTVVSAALVEEENVIFVEIESTTVEELICLEQQLVAAIPSLKEEPRSIFEQFVQPKLEVKKS